MQQTSDNNQTKRPVTGNEAVLALLDSVRRGKLLAQEEALKALSSQETMPDNDSSNPETSVSPSNLSNEIGTHTIQASSTAPSLLPQEDDNSTEQKAAQTLAENPNKETKPTDEMEQPSSELSVESSDISSNETPELSDNSAAQEADTALSESDAITNPLASELSNPSPRRILWIPRFVATLLCILALIGPMVWSYFQGKLYYVYNDKAQCIGLTHAPDARSACEEYLDLYDEDTVTVRQLGSTGFVSPVRSFPVSITADGETREFRLLEGTAGDLMKLAEVTLGADDLCSHEADDVLSDGEKVIVQRVTYQERTVLDDTVEWKEVTKPSPLIREGTTRAVDEGEMRDGVADRVYREKYIDGELVESIIVSEDISKYPWNAVTLVGDPDAVLSPIDGADFTDVKIVDGVPESYQYVISNGVCTAYSFNPGVWGASGTYLFQGFVAVDPAEIPLGSLLYVTRRDGSFVYGWAIAADVGEAMVDGRVDIDCFMETYDESALFGRKIMDIYVVEQLTQEDLQQFVANPGMFRNRIPASVNETE